MLVRFGTRVRVSHNTFPSMDRASGVQNTCRERRYVQITRTARPPVAAELERPLSPEMSSAVGARSTRRPRDDSDIGASGETISD
jgi:hypothetical protein